MDKAAHAVVRATGRAQECDLLIRNALILTVDRDDRVIEDGAIAVKNGRIVAIGPTEDVLSSHDAARIVDAGGGVAHPGFIDAHVHISQYTSRSVLPLMEGTRISMGDWKGALTPEDEHASAALAAIDYLKSGYTGFVDPGTIFEPDAVAPVADEIRIRIWLTDPYVADLGDELAEKFPEFINPAFLALWPKNLDEAQKRMGQQLARNNNPDGLVQGFVGLYGEDTDSEELFRLASDLARTNGVQVQKHLGYSPLHYRKQEAQVGGSLLEHLQDRGLLGPHLTFVHMNAIRPSDVQILAGNRVGVVWCPYGQLQMLGGAGTEGRMVELHRAGGKVGIASDIPRAVHFSGLGTLATVSAAATGLAAWGSEILRMRTFGAAATVGADRQVGNLEVGKRADIVLRKPDASENLKLDPATEFGVIAGPDSISAVFVDGQLVVEKGEVKTCDEKAIVTRAHCSVRGLATRLGLV
jgi:5-methylthioadenosine/S-adenosylhomocysteine deaminase